MSVTVCDGILREQSFPQNQWRCWNKKLKTAGLLLPGQTCLLSSSAPSLQARTNCFTSVELERLGRRRQGFSWVKTKAIASDRGSGNDISFVMLWGFISSRFVCLFSECQKSTTKLMVRFSVCMIYLETEKNPSIYIIEKASERFSTFFSERTGFLWLCSSRNFVMIDPPQIITLSVDFQNTEFN